MLIGVIKIQGTEDVLSTYEEVIKEFVKSKPQITKIYVKSDNACCYLNFQNPEALFKIIRNYDLTLQRYDFNEPARGKDQCDRESATAKSIVETMGIITLMQMISALLYGSSI